MDKDNKFTHVVIILNDEAKTELRYVDATLAYDEVLETYIIRAIIQLPLEERDPENPDKKIEYGYFNVIERIPKSEVLRIYTLNKCK